MGFKEIDHSADLAMLVWGGDLESLFKDAAIGMYALMGIHSEPPLEITREIFAKSEDKESLLVIFLSELLFLLEQEGLAFAILDLQIHTNEVKASLKGSSISEPVKLIKAVTFHNLEIKRSTQDFMVEIVFDV